MQQRVVSLDFLRGLAALAVIIWHWNWLNFDPATGKLVLPSADQLPIPFLLYPIYKIGYLAVDLFFAISGFVFFHMYGERLTHGEITAREFWWNRFTRLYPLHFVTLLLVAALQSIYYTQHSVYFVYPDNTLAMFGLQIFMASNWMPEWPFSFNGPIWSVSIEILLYALFFVLARRGLATPWSAVVIVLLGSFLIAHAYLLGRGVTAFFIGALCFFTFKTRRNFPKLAVALAGAGCIQVIYSGMPVRDAAVVIVGAPVALLVLSFGERFSKIIVSKLAWLGDISYSSYLLHFPMTLALVTFGVTPNLHSGGQLIAYIAGVISLSLICFHCFERPVQNMLRGLSQWTEARFLRIPGMSWTNVRRG